MTSEEGELLSKEVLHKIRDLVTELRSIDPTVQAVSTLNEAQKLVIEIEKLEKDLPTAGFFKKRGMKKALTQNKEKFGKLSEDLLNTLLVGYRKIYFDLANNIKEIAKFIPQETETIRKLQIPSFNVNEIVKFSSGVLRTYNQISEVLRGKNVSILLFNREIIELYGKFVNFDEEKIRITNQTTKTSIHVMAIPDLLEVYSQLEAENAYLKQRRKGTEGKIQLAIIQMSSELQQHIDTVASIGLDLWAKIDALKEEIQDIQTSTEKTTSVETLIGLEKRLNLLSNEFVNALRTYEISLKTETEDQIGLIIQITGREGLESSFSPVPETDVSSTSIPTIIQDIEKIRSWRQQQIIATKKMISTSELINASKAIRAMKIPVPPDFTKDVRTIGKDAAKTRDLQEWVELAKRYHELKSSLAEECQNYFFRLLENPHIQEVINLVEGPQIPTIRDFEALSPSELSSKAREIKDWETRLVAYFSKPAQQSLRQNLLNLYDSRESLRDILSKDLKDQIEYQRKQKIVEEIDIRDLVHEIEVLHRLNANIKTELWNKMDNEIHPIYHQLTNLETIPPKLKAHVPILAVEDLKSFRDEASAAAKKSIQELLDEYEKIPVWKYKISSRIHENLKSIPFPLIPIETRFDLREKRNQIVSSIDKYSESGDIGAVIKEYISFLETIEENKNEILIELKKQITNLEGVDRRLFRLLKSRKSSLIYSTDREINDLDYFEALTEFWQLRAFIERKASTLVEQMEREISSHIQDYSKLPTQYAIFFEETLELMHEKMAEIKTHKDIVRLVNVFESYSLESLQMAKDSLATLHQNLFNWLRVSLPRINEITPVDDTVFAAEKKISDFEAEEVSHERLAHKLRQLIFLYDTEIVAILLAHGVKESRKVLKNVNDLKEVGINIIEHVGGYIEAFSQVIVKNQEDVQLREITEVFVEIDRLQTDTKACREIRSMGKRYITEIQDAVEYLFNHYEIDLRQDERVDLAYLSRFQEIATTNHISRLTQAILELVSVRGSVIEIMKKIEKDRNAALQTELGNLEYYSNIQEVFKRYTEEASKRIFPLSKLVKAREEFLDSHDLRYILELLPQIDEQRNEWKKVSVQLNHWHHAIRMFRPRYSPTESKEENSRQYKEISKKIRETYPHNEVIRSYLSLVMKLLIEIKSGIKL
ncbi:MAG: hypothetical protein JSU57_05145 [Candidatus Heimdallarchaeota archaeon]|nr:MAG: hypothetical protein JSU57_05145 [Candidatus Heimdallarchaeota archaeon]